MTASDNRVSGLMEVVAASPGFNATKQKELLQILLSYIT